MLTATTNANEEESRSESTGIIQFGSGADAHYRLLSNFSDARFIYTWPVDAALVPFHMRGHTATYDSSEHAFQALRSLNLQSARAFETGGLLSGYDAFARWPVIMAKRKARGQPVATTVIDFQVEDRSSKIKYWNARKCCGIVAKMAAALHPQLVKAAWGLELGPPRPRVGFAGHCTLWVPLLVAKFEQNPAHMGCLLRTGRNALLVETSRYRIPSNYWNAYVEKPSAENPKGRLLGHNMMGRIMMAVRDHFWALQE